MPSPGVCRGCKAKVLWIRTTKGKWMIVDPDQIAATGSERNLTLVTDNGNVYVRPHAGVTGYVPHWAVCPQSQSFKKEKTA